MAGSYEQERFEKGLSTRYLLIVFLAGVAVCAVFFSLGFLVGYNERSSRVVPLTENVTGSSSVIPPTINSPAGTSGAPAPGSSQAPASGSADQISTESVELGKPERTQPPPPVRPPLVQPAPDSLTPGDSRPAASSTSGGVSQTKGLAVQVTALRDKREAEALAKTLNRKGFAAFLVTPQAAHAGDRLYRVHVGPFATRGEAEKVVARLSKQGFKPFIKR